MLSVPTTLRFGISLLCGLIFLPGTGICQLSSSVSLSPSPNPSAYGQAVTLQANVTAGATGKVTFYDGPSVLGIAPVSGNQAVLVTKLLAAGTRSLHAYYSGDSTYAASGSSTAVEVVTAATSLGFKAPVNYTTGGTGGCIAVGDFNDDSAVDLAVPSGSTVSILLGNGDGTFRTATQYNAATAARCIVAGDFNGDGATDLAVTSQGSTYVAILLGNGDGTFRAPVNYTTGSNPQGLVAGDFNRDGIIDLAVVNESSSSISVLLGRGDGTFQTAVNYPNVSYAQFISTGDFNNDASPIWWPAEATVFSCCWETATAPSRRLPRFRPVTSGRWWWRI